MFHYSSEHLLFVLDTLPAASVYIIQADLFPLFTISLVNLKFMK